MGKIIIFSVVSLWLSLLFGFSNEKLTQNNIMFLKSKNHQLRLSSAIDVVPIKQLRAEVWSITDIYQNESFTFSDIRLTPSDNNWKISNYGSDPLTHLIVRYKDESLALIVLNNPLPAYSQARLTILLPVPNS